MNYSSNSSIWTIVTTHTLTAFIYLYLTYYTYKYTFCIHSGHLKTADRSTNSQYVTTDHQCDALWTCRSAIFKNIFIHFKTREKGLICLDSPLIFCCLGIIETVPRDNLGIIENRLIFELVKVSFSWVKSVSCRFNNGQLLHRVSFLLKRWSRMIFWLFERWSINVKYGFIGELVEQMEFKCSKKKLYLKPNQILWFLKLFGFKVE